MLSMLCSGSVPKTITSVLVSFTRVAGTCMCGHLIAALCLLRLKSALLACVYTPEFLRAKKHHMVMIALTKEVV